MSLDQEKLNEMLHRGVNDFGATFHAACVVLGDKLGLYKGLASGGPQTPLELAKRTGTTERYVREWLSSQTAGGYITLDATTGRFHLTEEQAFTLADEKSPAFLPGAFQLALAATKAVPRLIEAFRSGEGMGWHEHDHELFHGTERFFRPGYGAHLVSQWIPALTGVDERLKAGGKVADVGCGHGSSTVLMALSYPKSKFVGYDYHEGSIQTARERARESGVADRVKFEVARAKDYPGDGYDFVTFFDCLHDMGDPVGAARHVRSTLSPDGTWMIVEPFANDRLEDNLNPIGRVFYSASTLLCTPASLSQEVGLALGAQAGEKRMKDVVTAGGFTRFRRATETPFNLIYEARP
jgi:SAM-dependent methyltransferase